jgi:DNA polymerase-1
MIQRYIIGKQGEIPALFKDSKIIAIDCETYSLSVHSKAFAFQITDGKNSAYINLNPNGPLAPLETFQELSAVFNNAELIIFTNAKFDLHKMANMGMDFTTYKKRIWDTMVFERMLDNDSFAVGMDASLKKRGREKDKSVEEYIKTHKLIERVAHPVSGEIERNKRFDLVPFDVMVEYGFSDVENTFWIYEQQIRELKDFGIPDSLIENELLLIGVVFQMERRGFKVDIEKTKRAMNYEQNQINYLTQEISSQLGRDYEGGPIFLEEALKHLALKVNYSTNGKAKSDEETLSKLKNPVIDMILKLRKHEKNISTFYSSFLYYGSEDGAIHADYNLASTRTGRFSCSRPNIQQTSKEEEEGLEFCARGCLVPRDGFVLVSIDYKSMEYRVMVDLAGEKSLLKPMINGLDIHQVTADLIGTKRSTAKTINFLNIFGGGAQVLADTIGTTLSEAQEIKRKYFEKLPAIKQLMYDVMNAGKNRGWVKNRFGRKYRLKDPNFTYKLPNYIIQGGCSDVVKFAMVEMDPIFHGKKSGIVAQLHDELIAEIHKSELDLVWKVKSVMENTYKPFNDLGLECDVEIYKDCWAPSTLIKIEKEDDLYGNII